MLRTQTGKAVSKGNIVVSTSPKPVMTLADLYGCKMSALSRIVEAAVK